MPTRLLFRVLDTNFAGAIMSQVEQCYWLVADGGKSPRFICIEAFGLRWTDVDELRKLNERERSKP